MGVRASTCVWELSKAKGSELLVLLRIADWADEDGRNAWASVVKIAKLTRLTDRGVRDILRRLVVMGELVIEPNTERRTVKDGYRPRAFMHVCCAARSEKISDAGDADDRKRFPVEAEKISGFSDHGTGKDFRDNRKLTRTKPEDGRTHIRKIRQRSISTHETRARDARRLHPLDEPVVLSPKMLELLDELSLVYPRKDGSPQELARVWRELNLSVEKAQFVIAHVRMRVAAGWVDQAGGVRYVPMLWRFLEGRRWEERASAVQTPAAANAWGADGTLTMATCRECGDVLEGRVTNGRPVYPPCPRCRTEAPATAAAPQQMERVV